GSLSNNIQGQAVELTIAGGATRSATTDDAGRAEFTGLTPGQQVQASTVVDGTRLESQSIAMPAQGGIRVMLFASSEPIEPIEPTEPIEPVPGSVVLGAESRFIVEQGDESLSVFYILEIVNTARA